MISTTSLITTKNNFKNKIYTIRNVQVMLDEDLAFLYKVETRKLNQAVKRNKDRFPDEFCFRLNKEEYENLKSQFVTSSLKSQFATSNKRGGRRAKNGLPVQNLIIRRYLCSKS